MKPTLKSTLAALSLVILAAFAFSGCESTRADSESGTHNMGSHNATRPMSNRDMPPR